MKSTGKQASSDPRMTGKTHIVTVFNQKGGCGKTMISMQLAGTLATRGLKVFLVDMDPQNTAALWYHGASAENPFPAEVMSLAALEEAFTSTLAPIADKFDIILIDCPPAIKSRVPWTAVLASDLALIPVAPVMDNVWASRKAEELVIEARKMRENLGEGRALNAAYVLNMIRRGKIFDNCLQTLKEGAQIPILKSAISMRNVFPESQLFGCVASGFGASQGAREVDDLTDEVLKLLGITAKRKG